MKRLPTTFLLMLGAMSILSAMSSEPALLLEENPLIGEQGVSFERMAPPAKKVEVKAGQAEKSPAEIIAFEEALQVKQDSLSLSVTVFDHSVSRIQWIHDEKRYVVYANLDFDQLRYTTNFEINDTRYLMFMGHGHESSADAEFIYQHGLYCFWSLAHNEWVPHISNFEPGNLSYLVEQGDPTDESAFTGLEDLLAYYLIYQEKIIAELALKKAAQAEYEAAIKEEKAAKANTPTVVQFWKNE